MYTQVLRRLRQLHFLFAPPPHLRREHERFTVELPVDVIATRGAEPLRRMAIDVSDGGMLIAPGVDAAPGASVYVNIGDLLTLVEARVIAHRDAGTALQFVHAAHGAALRTWLVTARQSRR
ncbi:MAG: PilZ domain-containing protein [Pseudomonadota bacterium]|nr:PilZ domain-containing protein [Pseudomonadota bacterium]